jgi:hypothetical protein
MNMATLTPLEYWTSTQAYWRGAARLLCPLGLDTDPTTHPYTYQGLTYYLDAAGVAYFTGEEAAKPHYPDKAAACGYKHFLLPQEMWLVYAVQLTGADKLRKAAGSPVTLRNVWRPREYNLKVSTAPYSDHVWGCGMDLDFKSLMARRRASKVVQAFWDTDCFKLSVGTGARTIHLGMFAPQTLACGHQRKWKYGSI